MVYDVVVLGAGPGGYVSAIRAAQMGAKTAIIEKNKFGGTCLNSGCIPTKALMKNVDILHAIKLGKGRGIKVSGLELDYKKAVKAKNSTVRQLVAGVEGIVASNGIDVYQGRGTVLLDKTIEIENENGEAVTIEYERLIIATGSVPAMLPIEGAGLDGVMTSEEILNEETIPEHLVIIGGGVIGCEFATIYNAYGSKVTIVEMLPKVVGMLDESVSENMEAMLEEKGIALKLGKQVKRISGKEGGRLELVIGHSDGAEELIEGDKVLVSVGRKPVLDGLEGLGLKTEKGYIAVDEKLKTSCPDVFAIGDVTGKKMLAHVASEMGVVAAENAMGSDKTMELDIVPSCIYTIPEVGVVGMTEKEAKTKGYEVVTGTFPLMACGKAVAAAEPEGMFKLVADKKTRKILGAHLIGKSATEIVAEMSAYMKMGARIEDVVDTIHAHPTISEAIAEAARDMDGCTIHMPKRK